MKPEKNIPTLKDVLALPRYAKDLDLLRNMLLLITAASLIAVGIIYVHYEKALSSFMKAQQQMPFSPYKREFQYMNHVAKFFTLCYEVSAADYRQGLEKAGQLATAHVLEKIRDRHQKERMMEILSLYDHAGTRVFLDSIVMHPSELDDRGSTQGILYGRQELFVGLQVRNTRGLICSFELSDIDFNDEINSDGAVITVFEVSAITDPHKD